jgi:hypothetical protein
MPKHGPMVDNRRGTGSGAVRGPSPLGATKAHPGHKASEKSGGIPDGTGKHKRPGGK